MIKICTAKFLKGRALSWLYFGNNLSIDLSEIANVVHCGLASVLVIEFIMPYMILIIGFIMPYMELFVPKLDQHTPCVAISRRIFIQCILASARFCAIAFFWNVCSQIERISLDMADWTHFKWKRSKNSERSINCTEWKSVFRKGLCHHSYVIHGNNVSFRIRSGMRHLNSESKRNVNTLMF